MSYGQGAQANKWVLFIQGGGWCYSVSECYGRSQTDLGSSKSWPPFIADLNEMSGMFFYIQPVPTAEQHQIFLYFFKNIYMPLISFSSSR